jgi:hypothetical protein
VLSVKWRGKELWGTIEVLPTPSGLLLWELYARGVRVGVSSRSWASLEAGPRGLARVADDLRLITFDCVVEPSNAGAFLTPLAARYRCAGLCGGRWGFRGRGSGWGGGGVQRLRQPGAKHG